MLYRSTHQWEILLVFGNFQSSSYYCLGCGPNTEIDKKLTMALKLVLCNYVIVGTVKILKILKQRISGTI